MRLELGLRVLPWLLFAALAGNVGGDAIVSVPVVQGHFVGAVRATGRIVPMEGALFVQAARVSGRLLEIEKREGEHVSVGTPLYRISSAECAALAEELRVATERKLDELVAATQRRQARLDLKIVDDDCIILAAHAGVVTKRFVEPGANFNAGDPLAHIVDTKRLTIELDVPEKDAGRIAVGRRTTVRLASDPEKGKSYETRVRTIVPTVDPTTRTTRARLDPVKFAQPMTVESFVVADIETDKPELSFIVPSSALVFHQGKQWVLKTATGPGKPSAVPVEVLDDDGDKTSIRVLSRDSFGVTDRVVTHGAVLLFKQLRSEN